MRVGGEVEELRRVGVAEHELPAAVAQGDHRRAGAFGGVLHRHRAAGARRRGGLAVGPGATRRVDAASSARVGTRSSVETGRSTRPGARPGAASISGTRAEPSRKLILNQRPRSPSMSPWSERKTTTVSAARPSRSSEAEELADLLVDVGDRGEVAAAGAADMLGGDREGGVVGGGHQPLRVRVLVVERDRRDRRVEGRAIGVEVPVARAGDVGVVRMGEADGQAPRPRVGPRARS